MSRDIDFERSIYAHAAQAAPAESLFDTFADKVLRRVDEVIAGSNVPWPCTAQERRFLELLRPHQGKGRVVSLGLFAERLQTTPRMVKEYVQSLRVEFGVQVGASREGESGGYYLCSTYEESVESTEQMFRQAVSMLKVVNQMRGGRQGIEQLLTQLRLDLTEEVATR